MSRAGAGDVVVVKPANNVYTIMVIVATLARGKEAFTFLAMTYADSDLIQIQENVIAKSIASLQFTATN